MSKTGTYHLIYSFFFFFISIELMSQTIQPEWSEIPPLPDQQGFAGMYAGVSSGVLLAMGGANFPDRLPWEGGKKKWYDHIYVLQPGGNWELLDQKLPCPSGYGVSVTYGDQVILVGGSTETTHLRSVHSCQWTGKTLLWTALPELPISLANMGGALLDNWLFIFGGMETPTGTALDKVFLLDLKQPEKGWQATTPLPENRIFPVSGVWNGMVYVMGGENTRTNSVGETYRNILLDNYSLQLQKEEKGWKAVWKERTPVPRGVSAGGTTLPLLRDDRFLIWGGVDAVTAQYRTPETHPGIVRTALYYYPQSDTWEYLGEQQELAARVTLPVVKWQQGWIYVSGEVKPGIRTPSSVQVR